MKRSRFTVEKIFQILTEGESKTFSVAEVCRKYNISGNTYYNWRRRYKGLSIPEAKRLKYLDEENNQLKKLLAERDLEVNTLRVILKENFFSLRKEAAIEGYWIYESI